MRRSVRVVGQGWLLFVVVLVAMPSFGQDPNMCDQPGEFPDVIVGDLFEVDNYGNAGDYYGYSIGTASCNIGTCWLNWFSSTNQHPVIAQNMYRVKDGRLDQIGQSWLKHGFFALSQELCSTGCETTTGTHLGVSCSDPYTAMLNGRQDNLGPRHEVNPTTGVFPYPFTGIGQTGDQVFRRVRVHRDDLDPALNAGATYFAEGHYVAQDDAEAGNGLNNVSWREFTVDPGTYDLALAGSTSQGQSAIQAWKTFQPTVAIALMDVPNEGQLQLGADTFLNPDGSRRFVYSIQNINSDRGARAFFMPVPQGATVTNIGFNDIDSHSGDPYDTTDWAMYYDYPNSRVVWETPTFAENEFANPIRWGTAYSFWFDIVETPWTFSPAEIGLFKPGPLPTDPDTLTSILPVYVPVACNDNAVCEPGETCANCPNDCTAVSSCCGDAVCDGTEDPCSCAVDCGPVPLSESTCNDGVDNDCDGGTDCGDLDCCTDGLCTTGNDNDNDGVTDCDCNDNNPSIWGRPAPTGLLTLDHGGASGTSLDWSVPANPGATTLDYETMRVGPVEAFKFIASCLADPSPQDLTSSDADDPGEGNVFHYLIRATNACPGPAGTGSLGQDSGGADRQAPSCP